MKRNPKKQPIARRPIPKWVAGLGVFSAAFLLGSLIITYLPKTYETSTTILVRPMSDFVLDPGEAAIGGSFQERVNNQIALFNADETATEAQAYLEEFIQTKRCDMCEHVVPNLLLGILSDDYQLGRNYAQEFRKHLKITPLKDSHVVTVTYHSDSDRPQDLRTLLSIYLTAFQSQAATFGREMVREQMEAVQEQLKIAQENRKEALKALEDFQKTHETLDPNKQLNAWVLEQAHLREALKQNEADLAATKTGQKETQGMLALSVPTVKWLSRLTLDEEINGLQQQIVQVYREKADWLSRTGVIHNKQLFFTDKGQTQVQEIKSADPAVVIKLQTLDEEIAYLNKLIKARIDKLLKAWESTGGQKPPAHVQKQLKAGHVAPVGSIDVQLAIRVLELEVQMEALKSKQAVLKHGLTGVDHKLKNVPALQLDFAKLQAKTQLADDKCKMLALQASRLETAQPTHTVAPLVVLKKPYIPAEPTNPNYPLLYAIAFIVSAILGALAMAKLPQEKHIYTQQFDYSDVTPESDYPHYYAAPPTPQFVSEAPHYDDPLMGDTGLSPALSADDIELETDFIAAPPTAPRSSDASSKAKAKLASKKKGKKEKKPKATGSLWAALWPFGKSKKEGRLLPNFRKQARDAGHDMDTFADDSVFHMSPLPDLPTFIAQMEGEDPYALQSESMEALRAFLIKNRQQSRIQRIGVVPVSAFSTAQSTLLALCLNLAESGQKLALIDLDFSDLSLSRWISSFPIPLARGLQEGQGASEYLEGISSDFVDVIYPLGKSVYGSFIPAGHVGGLKDIALGPEHISRLAGELSPNYDFVLYALPALEQSAAACQVGQVLDGIILVSHPGITKAKEKQQALQLLKRNGVTILAELEQP